MQAGQILGGYSLGGADLLRQAMGKKKPEEMATHRAIFREGAAKKGISAEVADEVFDLMEKFAGYGFNKAHATAYSLLAYHTAWIKVHFAAEFFAANMSVEIDNSDKLKALLVDAKTFGVTIETPDVNAGTYRFEPMAADSVRYGLGAIKGTGQGAIEAIVAAREEGGPFTSLFDFCARVDRGRINRRVVEALIKAGAFDRIHPGALVAAGERRPGARLGRDAGRARRPGRPLRRALRRRRLARREHRGAAARRRARVEHQGAPDAREVGARLLPLGAPLRPERGRGAALRQAAHRRPDRQARDAAAGRHRRRPARRQRPARPGRPLQARRHERFDRGGRQRRAAQRQPRAAEGRRARHRPGPGPAGSLLRRRALQRAERLGPRRGALPLRQVPARRGQRQRAAGRRGAARLPVAPLADRARRDPGRPARSPAAATARGDRRARPRRRGPLLPERRRPRALADGRRARPVAIVYE